MITILLLAFVLAVLLACDVTDYGCCDCNPPGCLCSIMRATAQAYCSPYTGFLDNTTRWNTLTWNVTVTVTAPTSASYSLTLAVNWDSQANMLFCSAPMVSGLTTGDPCTEIWGDSNTADCSVGGVNTVSVSNTVLTNTVTYTAVGCASTTVWKTTLSNQQNDAVFYSAPPSLGTIAAWLSAFESAGIIGPGGMESCTNANAGWFWNCTGYQSGSWYLVASAPLGPGDIACNFLSSGGAAGPAAWFVGGAACPDCPSSCGDSSEDYFPSSLCSFNEGACVGGTGGGDCQVSDHSGLTNIANNCNPNGMVLTVMQGALVNGTAYCKMVASVDHSGAFTGSPTCSDPVSGSFVFTAATQTAVSIWNACISQVEGYSGNLHCPGAICDGCCNPSLE